MIGFWQSLGDFIKQFLELFQRFLIRTKFKGCTLKSEELVHEYYHKLQTVFIENSGLPSGIDSTWVSFHSTFISRLYWDVSPLVKKDWNVMENCPLQTYLPCKLLIPYMSHIQGQSPKFFNSRKWWLLSNTKALLVFATSKYGQEKRLLQI